MTKQEKIQYNREVHLSKVFDHNDVSFGHLEFLEKIAKALANAPHPIKKKLRPILSAHEGPDGVVINIKNI